MIFYPSSLALLLIDYIPYITRQNKFFYAKNNSFGFGSITWTITSKINFKIKIAVIFNNWYDQKYYKNLKESF